MSTRKIKKHIDATKEIARITNVMYLLAAYQISKVRKRYKQACRYSKAILHFISIADANVKRKDLSLLTQRRVRNMLYVVISPNMGFCGGLPSMINRWAITSAEEQQNRVAQASGGKLPATRYLTVGKKGRDYLIRTNRNLVKAFTPTEPTWALAQEITQFILEAFHKEEIDAAFIVYARSGLETPQPVVEQLLPVSLSVATKQEPTNAHFFFFPKVDIIFPELVLHYLVSHIYGALLEGALSEYTARMVTMKQATNKAKEALDDLTVAYHRARQAQITTELLEITAAAEALRQQLFP